MMGAGIGILSMLGIIVCVILLIVFAIKKRPKKKIWLALAVCFVLFVGAMSMPTNTDEQDNNQTASDNSAALSEENKAPDITEESEGPKPSAEETTASEESDDENVAAVQSLLELNLKDAFDYAKVEGDSTGFIIYVAEDGLTASVVTAKAAGYDETYSDWVDMKDSLMSLYDSTYEFIEISGMENLSLMLIVLNDTNKDNYLLVIHNGEFTYDVMAE